jgi:plasmid stabilization system protein ParE
METYKLRILPSAQEDMPKMVKYVNTLSSKAALNLYDEMIDGIGSLTQMPLRCPLLKIPKLRAKGYRALLVKNYMVLFVVLNRTVQIRRILYAKRQFTSLL